jgi:hypothetical protein
MVTGKCSSSTNVFKHGYVTMGMIQETVENWSCRRTGWICWEESLENFNGWDLVELWMD